MSGGGGGGGVVLRCRIPLLYLLLQGTGSTGADQVCIRFQSDYGFMA